MASYTTIIFDLDGVLVEHDFSNECKNLCKILDIPYSCELENEYYEFWNKFNEIFVGKRINEQIFTDALEEQVKYFGLFNKFGMEIFNAIKENDTVVKLHDYTLLLKKIREKGLSVVALTDWFYDGQMKVLSDLGYLKYFDRIYTFDNWYMKPDARAINRIISKKDKNNFIFVGDKLDVDIACANGVGVKSVWYNPNSKINDTIYIPDYEIKDLEVLLEIV